MSASAAGAGAAPARPIRALVTVIGLDQHEAGSLAVARLLRDAGMEVVYGGRFQTPQSIAATAEQEDVDVVGISAHSWEFLHYAEELVALLHDGEPPIPVIVGGSVITEADRREVLEKGLDEALAPSASTEEVVEAFRRLAAKRRAG